MMANKAMKQRHWDRITGLTGHKFEVDSDTFSLQNIMEAPLLKYKEDIEVSKVSHCRVFTLLITLEWLCYSVPSSLVEALFVFQDICISAVKEKDIEAKLSQVVDVWSSLSLSFMNFKGRGELMLRGTDTAEIVTAMEDSLMLLGSLLSNR